MILRLIIVLAFFQSGAVFAGPKAVQGQPFQLLGAQHEQLERTLLEVSDELINTLVDRGSRRWVSPYWKRSEDDYAFHVLNLGPEAVNVTIKVYLQLSDRILSESGTVAPGEMRKFTDLESNNGDIDFDDEGWAEILADGPVFVEGIIGFGSSGNRLATWYRTAPAE